MTPKEKALELVYKYENLVTSWDCYYDTEILTENRLPDMKQCALIAVDEIIDALDYLFGTTKEVTYWREVKQEIEKL